ncbi:MAG: carboxypeptidase regulatory-like domain-containing protein [Planctomycetes bacterium]|nr:carboxypeptidase regulatory-like domain-containing protein [Planctomycetota bacterium]
MVGRLALLCVVEGIVVLVLALQLCGASGAPAQDSAALVPPANEIVAAQQGGDKLLQTPTAAGGPVVVPARTAVAASWQPDDPVGVLLTGAVQSADGEAVDAYIGMAQGQETRGASAEKDGAFAIVGLRPGEWQVTLRGDRIVETKTTITLGDEAVQRHDFVVKPAFPVKVHIVTADGADATKALRSTLFHWGDFHVVGQRDAFPDRLAPTDYGALFVGDARWRGEMNPADGFAGTLFLSGVPAHVALLQRSLVIGQQIVQPGQGEVRFVVDVAALEKLAATATLRVLDADTGTPLAGAHASLRSSNGGGGRTPGVDESGRVTLTGLSPGLLLLSIEAKDHESVWTTVRVEPGRTTDLGDFRLGAAEDLKGTLLDADGKPASGHIQWTELKWRTAPTAFCDNRSTNVEADGSFRLWRTGRGPIAVQARTQDGRVAAGVFDNPPAEPVVLRFGETGECRVTRPADPTRAFTVTLFDRRHLAIAARVLEPRILQTTIRLPVGDYTFEVHDDRQQRVQAGSLTFGSTPCALEIR